MNNKESLESFRSSLDANHQWPCWFSFKFIVPEAHIKTVLELFADDPVQEKEVFQRSIYCFHIGTPDALQQRGDSDLPACRSDSRRYFALINGIFFKVYPQIVMPSNNLRFFINLMLLGIVCQLNANASENQFERLSKRTTMNDSQDSSFEIASFGAGCFWCVEAVFENLEGVKSVESGYMGGHLENPTYETICTGTTGHAEIVQITFDPKVIEYKTLLDWLWRSHDPTTLNRQGADQGTQYRSVIFYHSEDQRAIAETSKAKAQKHFDEPIVTEITAASEFYPAENYHQNYYQSNKAAPYCQMVIRPKLKKLGL